MQPGVGVGEHLSFEGALPGVEAMHLERDRHRLPGARLVCAGQLIDEPLQSWIGVKLLLQLCAIDPLAHGRRRHRRDSNCCASPVRWGSRSQPTASGDQG